MTCVLAPAIASAQGAQQFVYFAPGHADTEGNAQTFAAGIGIARVLEPRLTVQVDLAALSYYEAQDSRKVGGVASFDGAVELYPQHRVEPFLVAGYSLLFRDDATNMVNFGVGVRHWFREDRALLIEYRDHRADKDAVLRRFWSVRIGLVFR